MSCEVLLLFFSLWVVTRGEARRSGRGKDFFFLFSLLFNSCANKIREEGKDRKIGGRDLLKERNACTVNSR